MVDIVVSEQLEEGFRKLSASNSRSLLAKHLTRQVFDKIKMKRTTLGFTLHDAIQSGFEDPDCEFGIVAPDAESYTTFEELFNPIIEDYHDGYSCTHHPSEQWGNVDSFTNLDPSGEYVKSVRMQYFRSITGYPFNVGMTEDHFKEFEAKLSPILFGLEGELKGIYHPAADMSEENQKMMIGNISLQPADVCRFWPNGRGVYLNNVENLLIRFNVDEHFNFDSKQTGGDLAQVYNRLATAIKEIGKHIPFARSERYGFLCQEPSHIGTTVKYMVKMKLPCIAANIDKCSKAAFKYKFIVCRDNDDESSDPADLLIINKRQYGLTEYDIFVEIYHGILRLIHIERLLSSVDEV